MIRIQQSFDGYFYEILRGKKVEVTSAKYYPTKRKCINGAKALVKLITDKACTESKGPGLLVKDMTL